MWTGALTFSVKARPGGGGGLRPSSQSEEKTCSPLFFMGSYKDGAEEVVLAKRKGSPAEGVGLLNVADDRVDLQIKPSELKGARAELSGVRAQSSSTDQARPYERHAFSGYFNNPVPSTSQNLSQSSPQVEQPPSQVSSGHPLKCPKVDCAGPSGTAPFVSEPAASSWEQARPAPSPSCPPSTSNAATHSAVKKMYEIDCPSSRAAPAGRGAGVERRSIVQTGRGLAAPSGPPWQWFPPRAAQANGPLVPEPPPLPAELLEEEGLSACLEAATCAPSAVEQLGSPSLASSDLLGWVGHGKAEEGDAALSLEDLPRVLLVAVLAHLPLPRDVVAFGATSRAAREVASDAALWKALFASRWGLPAALSAQHNSEVSLQQEYASRERFLRELRSSPLLVGALTELEAMQVCRHLSGALDLLTVDSLAVCQAHAAILLKEVDLFLGLLHIFRRSPSPEDDPAYAEAYNLACAVYGTLVRRCQKLAGARLLRREDGRSPRLQGSSTPQCRFSCESIFAHFVQNLKKPSMYAGPLALPDPAGPPSVVCLEMCEALLPHMYLLPVQIWDLSTPIADWNGVEWPRFSEEPFRRWLLPDWRAQFPGLWHGYYMFRNQGQLGAPDPAMHLTLALEGVAPEEDGADWMYVLRGSGDDGMGPFSIEGTIRPVPPPAVPSSRTVFGGVEFSKAYDEALEEDGLLYFVGHLTALGMTGIWGNKLTENVKGTWAMTPVSAFPDNARGSLC
ncbi:hypothetical protein KFL_002640220 [Klebsormidium nitens]|uniref:F-box domain-containing protein n=1 Tax=Klebsormidium nitens TaxID=105231 RepID=A0A0U9HTE4_KLENI|nr:hypothetical protein KFL_002640220 [Klebsormidium nitens]|eukprot:GAQ86001.1 hypothetical protein KFL_002640220 [Klebsormidium nitens]